MGNFDRGRGDRDNNRFEPRRSFGGRDRGGSGNFGRSRFGGGRDTEKRQMHHAVCDQCGKDCEVPFRPSGDKPIYCSDCFEKQGGRDGQGRNSRDEGRRPQSQFNENSNRQPTNTSQYQEQFDTLNAKLDRILNILKPVEAPKVAKEETPVVQEVVLFKETVKPAKKKAVKKTTPKKTA